MSQGNLEYELNKPVPYKLDVEDALLHATKQKLELSRYPEEQTDVGEDDWSQGAKVDVVKRLAGYWKDHYNWRAEEVPLAPPSCRFLDMPMLTIVAVHRRPKSMTNFGNIWSR